MLYSLSVVFGLCLGSFFSVFISRLDRKDGIVSGRSECPKCGHVLAWYDLIPLVSYTLLAGRCRYCKTPVSVWYPAVEVGTAIIVIGFAYFHGVSVSIREVLLFLGALGFWVLFLFDLRYMILPDKVVFPMIFVGLAFAFSGPPGMWINSLLTGLLAFLFFDIIYVVWAGQGMGFGDVKLALLIGVYFGYPLAFLGIVVSVWLSALFGLMLVIIGRATMRTALPFGSFLSITSILLIIFYNDIFNLTSLFF